MLDDFERAFEVREKSSMLGYRRVFRSTTQWIGVECASAGPAWTS